MKEFNHQDIWRLHGTDFLVTVVRTTVDVSPEYNFDNLGSNRWAVYAYIYPKHTCFAGFDDSGMFQDAARALHFHGGPSFLQFHFDKAGKKQSVQVGADYNHLYDEEYSYYATKDDAFRVFDDAVQLYAYLQKMQEIAKDLIK
jgi:hypothetical protein